jgi:hypothetical protein
MGQRLLKHDEIHSLHTKKKPLPANWQTRLRPRPKSNTRFLQRDLDVTGEGGRAFRLVIRQSALNVLDFSIILIFVDSDGTQYNLTRFNGKHPSQHTNNWEHDRDPKGKHSFRNVFHIHHATERYQVAGYDIDGFAEETTRYSSFETALALFVRSNGFSVASDDLKQPTLYE